MLNGFRGFNGISQPSQIVETSLELWLDAANSNSYPGSGSTWFDLSGNSRNSTLINSPTFITNGPGSYFQFNGSTQYSELSYVGSPFRQLSQITYDFWLNWSSGSILSGTSSSGGQGTGGINFTGNSVAFVWTPTTPNSDRAWSHTFDTDYSNTWVNIAFTYNYLSAGSAQFYVNGEPVTTNININDVSNAAPTASYNQNINDRIAGRYVNTNYYSNVKFSKFRIYSRALTSEEIFQNFKADKNNL